MKHRKRSSDARYYFDDEPHWPAEDVGGFRWVVRVIAVLWIMAALLCVALVLALIWLVASVGLSIGGW